jgi:hypothetical protein
MVVFIGLRYCTIQIDMDTTMRPTEQRMGGLTVEEQAAIDALMVPYRRELGDSPVLRRYGRVPQSDTNAVAQRIFELAVIAQSPTQPAARHHARTQTVQNILAGELLRSSRIRRAAIED